MAVNSIPQPRPVKPSMTPSQIAIVKSTAPILKEHGVAITSQFYSNLLAAHPSLHNIFNRANQATGDQPRALANLVFAFASHADNLSALEAGIRRVAHKHVSLQVQPAQYPIVGEYLIAAVAAVLGPEVVTAEVADAWIAAYAVLADIFINVEADLYRSNQDRVDPVTGDKVWPTPTPAGSDGEKNGWRPFIIQRRVNESADGGIVSFYLTPKDDPDHKQQHQPALPSFKPGQYISIRVPVPELGGVLQPRQYSLSDSPGKEYYRISVKRERSSLVGAGGEKEQHPAGLVSNILHDKYQVGDVVEVTYPMGEFHPPSDIGQQPPSSLTAVSGVAETESLKTTQADKGERKSPMVLISAGVGVTPMISILHTALAAASNTSSTKSRPITWIHGSHDISARAFNDDVSSIASTHPDLIEAHMFLTKPDSSTTTTKTATVHKYSGRIDLSRLPQTSSQGKGLYLDDKTTEYFICGPRGFMDSVRAYLVEENGVDEDRVLREVFGTGN